MHSAKSTNHRSYHNNHSNNHLPYQTGVFENGRICDIRQCLRRWYFPQFWTFGIKSSFTKKECGYFLGNCKGYKQNLVSSMLVIKQIGRPRILLITRMITEITDRTGLISVLLPLLRLLGVVSLFKITDSSRNTRLSYLLPHKAKTRGRIPVARAYIKKNTCS